MAQVQHNCTGCVPIDASIIEVYTQLISTESRAEEAAERAEHAAEYAIGKSPYIGENGDWWEWDDEQAAFIDTGVQAQGQVAVDIEMSTTSTNPVQNRVITAAVNEKQDTLVSGTNIKTVNGESLLGEGNIIAGDPNAVKYVEQSLTDAQKAQARTNIAAYQKPAAGIPATDLTSAAQTSLGKADSAYQKPGSGIPKADLDSSVQTSLGKADTAIQDISGKQDVISDLSTIRSGAAAGATAYQKPSGGIPKSDLSSGVQGSLDLADSAIQARPQGEITPVITPADYATREELGELEAKLNNLANTRYYGIFTSSADLPADASENGYAYVGSSTPLAIYEFDGEDWNDTGVAVNSIQGEPGVGFESVASPTPADGTVTITLSNGDTMTLDLNHNHPAYYSKVAETSNPSGGFLPDVVYSLGTLTGTVTFALAAAVTGNVNHYFWMFDTGSTAPTITWPTGITWADGSAPTVAASKHYEISVLNGIAYYSEV